MFNANYIKLIVLTPNAATGIAFLITSGNRRYIATATPPYKMIRGKASMLSPTPPILIH